METIKTITLVMVALSVFGCACPDTKTSEEYPAQKIKDKAKSYTIYKPNSIIPEYEVRDGKVYKPGGLMPLYEIRGNKVYKPGGLMPIYELKEDEGFKPLVD